MKRVHVLISGNVTGVFFRKFISDNAEKLGVKGWVRNAGDKVEAVLEGSKVDELVELCKKGPSGARVNNIEVKEEEYKGEFDKFEQR